MGGGHLFVSVFQGHKYQPIQCKSDTAFKVDGYLCFSNHEELFENLSSVITDLKISKQGQTGLYYTANLFHEVGVRGKDDACTNTAMWWDIDHVDKTKYEQYIEVLSALLDIDSASLGVVATGNGLQFFMQRTPDSAIEGTKAFFESTKQGYVDFAKDIEAQLYDKKLIKDFGDGKKTHVDTSVWDRARLLRCPIGFNKKRGRTTAVECLRDIIQPESSPAVHRILEGRTTEIVLSHQPEADEDFEWERGGQDEQQIAKSCAFMGHVKEKGGNTTEPLWYHALTILAHCKDGKTLAHEYSNKHPDYDAQKTLAKLKHASETGPITCKNVNFAGCQTCPYNGKITSPIQLSTRDNFAKLIENNFHCLKAKRWTPQFSLAAKYLETQKLIRRSDGGQFYKYSYPTWEKVEEHQILTDTHLLFTQQNATSVQAERANSYKARYAQEVLQILRQGVPEDFTKDTRILTKNHLMDLTNGKVATPLSELPQDYFIKNPFLHQLDVDYNITDQEGFERGTERILKFFEQTFDGKSSRIKNWLLTIGRILDQSLPNMEKVTFLVGPGGTGKTTLLALLKTFLSKPFTVNTSLRNLCGHTSDYFLSQLEGKRVAILEEFGKRDFYQAESIFKTLCSGGRMTVRLPRKDPYEIDVNCVFVTAGNEAPISDDKSLNAMERRLLILETPNIPENPDPSLLGELSTPIMKTALFHLVLEELQQGKERLKQGGSFFINDATTQGDLGLFTEQNRTSTERFMLDEYGIPQYDELQYETLYKSKLFADYKDYCKDSNYIAAGKDKFGKDLKNYFLKHKGTNEQWKKINKRKREGVEVIRVLQNIRFELEGDDG